MLLAGLKGDLQHAVGQAITIEAGDGHSCLLIVGHGDEAESFAFVGEEIPDDFDVGDGAERTEELP